MHNTLANISVLFAKMGMAGYPAYIPDAYKEFETVFDVPEKPHGFSPRYSPSPDRILVPVSGGLDSTICYHLAKKTGKEVKAVYVDIGQEYAEKEMQALKDLGIEFLYFSIGDLMQLDPKHLLDWKHIIPARNFVILSMIPTIFDQGVVYFGALEGEIKEKLGGDKSRKFIELMRREYSKLPFPFTLELPLENMTKDDLVDFAQKELGLSSDYLRKTVTCFDGAQRQCGKCQACFRRYCAFFNAGIDTKDDYESPILENTRVFFNKYKVKLNESLQKKDFSEYSEKRCVQTLNILSKIQEIYPSIYE